MNETNSYNSNLTIRSLNENHFEVILMSDYNEDNLLITIHSSLGKEILYDKILNTNGIYKYDLDLSHLSSGVYLIRVGNNTFGKVQKLVVQ